MTVSSSERLQTLLEQAGVAFAYLFGSRATGKHHETSGAGIAVMVDLRRVSYRERVITDELIERAARRLAAAARPPARVMVFGSHARGSSDARSDVDFLVIERDVTSGFEEAARLRRSLRGLRVPADVIVVSEQQAEEWGDVENTMLHAALTEGRIVAEAE